MLEPGLYTVTRIADIRVEPRRVSWRVSLGGRKFEIRSNQRGSYAVGKQVEILSVTPLGKDNIVWGQVSEPDTTGRVLWIPMWDINGAFVMSMDEEPELDLYLRVAALERRVTALEAVKSTR